MSKLDRIVELEKELNELRAQVAFEEQLQWATPHLGARYPAPEPQEPTIFKPSRYIHCYWPAVRARNILKAVDPDAPRQSFDKNIRALAQKARTTPEDILRKNPIVVGRHLGIPEHRLSQIIGGYYTLKRDLEYKSDRQGRW